MSKDFKRKIYAVDIDDTIARGRFWTGECEPILEMIEKINKSL